MKIEGVNLSECLSPLVRQIETQLGWGSGADWTNRDFQELSTQIFERTHQQLSVTTLKRVWGRAERVAQPSGATLDILAEFAGYDSWRTFRQQHVSPLPSNGHSPGTPAPKAKPGRRIVGATLLGIALLSLAWYAMKNQEASPDDSSFAALSDQVQFSFEKVTTGYPNTVIFRYDVGDLPYDSLTLQQSWDTRKSMVLTEPQGLATTTYYTPGYYRTKLMVNDRIVREKDLYIPTQGWQGLVWEGAESFVYLKPEQLRRDSMLSVTSDVLPHLNAHSDALLYLANLTDDPLIDGTDFSLDTEFRLAQPTDRSACRYVRLTVTGTREVLGFHFSVPGCVGDLMFMLNKEMVSGRHQDLSAFGLDLSEWNRCQVEVQDRQLRVLLNEKEVFTHTLASNIGRVGGVQWTFEGVGEIRELRIEDKDRQVNLMNH